MPNLAAAVVWVIAAAVASWDLTVPLGVIAAAAGALAGCATAARPAPGKLRLWIPWAGGLLAILAAALLARLLRSWVGVSELLGPALVYSWSEALFWFILLAAVVGLIQFTRRRYRIFGLVELACIAAIFASALRAHRDGFLNRPFFFVDPLWSRGYDPLPALMMAGLLVLGIAILAVTLGGRRAGNRSSGFVRNGVVVAVLLLLVFLLMPKGLLKYLPDQANNGARNELKKDAGQGKASKNGKPQPGKPDQKGDDQKRPERKDQSADDGGSPQRPAQVGRENAQNDGGDGTRAGDPENQENTRSSSNSKEQPIAVVTFRTDYNSPYGVYYFRETAFSAFNGLRLVRDVTGNLDSDLANEYPSPQLDLNTPPLTHTVGTTVALLKSDARPLSLVNAFRLTEAPNPSPNRFLRAYDVQSYVVAGDLRPLLRARAGDPSWTPETLQHYLDAPSDPRYRKLAQQALQILPASQRDQPIAEALAVVNLLNETGTYGEREENTNHNQPLEKFLFGDRTGICIEFAHSACLLFRSLGIPSRVGAGYAVPVKQRGEGSSVLIRDGDAHAWPEVYVQGRGWIVLDVTPKKTIAPPRSPVDASLQQMLGDMARESPLNGKDTDPANPTNQMAQELWTLLKRLLVLGLIALYLINLWRRYEIYFCDEKRAPTVAYRVLLQHLAEAGRVRWFGETRESFALRNASVCPVLHDLTKWHLRSAFGPVPVTVERQKYLDMHRSAVRQLASHIPWWRRALGILNPLSAWRTG